MCNEQAGASYIYAFNGTYCLDIQSRHRLSRAKEEIHALAEFCTKSSMIFLQ